MNKIVISFLCVLICFLGTAACAVTEQQKRIVSKADIVKENIQESVRAGDNPIAAALLMKKAKSYIDSGNLNKAEALIDEALDFFENQKSESAIRAYSKPRVVEIKGYTGTVMEPFISYDGKILLFNNANTEKNPNLHLARKNPDGSFRYVRALTETQTPKLEGAPSLDLNNTLYYTSVMQYQETLDTIMVGKLEGNHVQNITLIRNQITPKKPGYVNMDVSISPDGKDMYISLARFKPGNSVPYESNILLARKDTRGRFSIDKSAHDFFKKINTEDLEYAPSISKDGLELYFTRAEEIIGKESLGKEIKIMVSTRKSVTEPFDTPKRIAGLTGFIEAPTITGDRKTIYYHGKNKNGKLVLYKIEKQ